MQTQRKLVSEIYVYHRASQPANSIPCGKSGNKQDGIWDFIRFWQEIKECVTNSSKLADLASMG